MTKMKDSDIATSGLLQVSVTAPDPQPVPAMVPDHQDIPAAVADHQADTPQPKMSLLLMAIQLLPPTMMLPNNLNKSSWRN